MEALRMYLTMVCKTLLGPQYDLKKIPEPSGVYWLLGHGPYFLRPDLHRQLLEWANEYGGICKFNIAGYSFVLVSDPAVAADVLGSGPGSVPRRARVIYPHFKLRTCQYTDFFTTSNEDHWRLIRRGTAAAFSSANIR